MDVLKLIGFQCLFKYFLFVFYYLLEDKLIEIYFRVIRRQQRFLRERDITNRHSNHDLWINKFKLIWEIRIIDRSREKPWYFRHWEHYFGWGNPSDINTDKIYGWRVQGVSSKMMKTNFWWPHNYFRQGVWKSILFIINILTKNGGYSCEIEIS